MIGNYDNIAGAALFIDGNNVASSGSSGASSNAGMMLAAQGVVAQIRVMEVGIWPNSLTFSTTQVANMCANQQAFWASPACTSGAGRRNDRFRRLDTARLCAIAVRYIRHANRKHHHQHYTAS
jgi:hypothetical protein